MRNGLAKANLIKQQAKFMHNLACSFDLSSSYIAQFFQRRRKRRLPQEQRTGAPSCQYRRRRPRRAWRAARARAPRGTCGTPPTWRTRGPSTSRRTAARARAPWAPWRRPCPTRRRAPRRPSCTPAAVRAGGRRAHGVHPAPPGRVGIEQRPLGVLGSSGGEAP